MAPSGLRSRRYRFIQAVVIVSGLLSAAALGPPALAAPQQGAQVIVAGGLYPWSAIGRVNTGGRSYCTGTLISPRHVLTQAGCLYYGVEGRWWAPQELHFVAGYERDRYRAHAGVVHYHLAPNFDAGRTQSLANVTNNWAILTLDSAIGQRAGWIDADWLGRGARRDLARGTAYVLQAGYRRGQDHVITVGLDCAIDSLARRRLKARGGCRGANRDNGLSRLLFIDDSFRALAPQSMSRATLVRILGSAGAGEGQAAKQAGAGERAQRGIMDRLLVRLGHRGGTPEQQASFDKAVTLGAVMSEAVSEPVRTAGKSKAEPGLPPAPSTVADLAPAGEAAADEAPVDETPVDEVYVVQLASFSTSRRADRARVDLQESFSDLLRGQQLFVVQATLAEQGEVYRLRSGPFASLVAARKTCAGLRARRQDCLVLR